MTGRRQGRRPALVVVLALTLGGCASTKPQTISHVQNRLTEPPQRPRQLVVFLDGTGNDVWSRTNVRRLFEMTVSRQQPEVIAYYDPGVGSGGSLITKFLGLGAGYGFQQNLREALIFLTENYRDKDEISIFGFSRGAYNAGVLASVVSGAGLPLLPWIPNQPADERHKRAVEAVNAYYRELRKAESRARSYADRVSKRQRSAVSEGAHESPPPEDRARQWRQHYSSELERTTAWSADDRVRPDIAVLGLWEPVNSLISGSLKDWIYGIGKVSLSVSDVSEFNRHKGHDFHPYTLGPKVKQCLFALSLDEERQSFVLELPDSALGMPEAHEFVWFVGDHSDVGGGHKGDKDLAGISMNWMLAHVGDRLLGDGGSNTRVYENPSGARHDLFLNKGWSRFAYRVRGEALGDRARQIRPLDQCNRRVILEPDADHLAPIRYEGWTMKIHQSVLERMDDGHDFFYVPGEGLCIIDLAHESLVAPRSRDEAARRAAEAEAEAAPKGPCPTSEAWKRNPKDTYHPRAFRNLPAVSASWEGWTEHTWTRDEILEHYEIVDTPESTAAIDAETTSDPAPSPWRCYPSTKQGSK